MTDSKPRAPWIFTGTVIAILFGHYIVDTYSSIVAPLIGIVENEFGMKAATAAILLGLGSVVSGISQPIFAWVSDRTRSRVYGPLGVLFAALGISLIGYAGETFFLFVIYCVGMMGVGMFHPIATARIGAIAGEQRGFALSLFFVFGMGGFFTGSLVGPYLATQSGALTNLVWLLVPGLLMAAALQLLINRTQAKAKQLESSPDYLFSEYDWKSITLLYFSAVFRFIVNLAFIYLVVRWVEQHVAAEQPELAAREVSKLASPIAGYFQAATYVGQGIGGLLAGALIKIGKEKLPLILTPILFAPPVFLMGFIEPGLLGYVACCLGGVAFASMTPITISVGQQLMPGHTRLASGLMLGGAWVIAAAGPRFAEFLNFRFGLTTAFVVMGVLSVYAGVVNLGLRTPRRND